MIVSNVMPRKLEKGFSWQEYKVFGTKPISKTYHHETHQSNRWNMLFEYEQWVNDMKAFINARAEELGLGVMKITAQLVEEPDESKILDVIYWNNHDCVFVWSVWVTLAGPVPTRLVREYELPLVNFWPQETQFYKDIGIFDATQLTKKEQGLIE